MSTPTAPLILGNIYNPHANEVTHGVHWPEGIAHVPKDFIFCRMVYVIPVLVLRPWAVPLQYLVLRSLAPEERANSWQRPFRCEFRVFVESMVYGSLLVYL